MLGSVNSRILYHNILSIYNVWSLLCFLFVFAEKHNVGIIPNLALWYTIYSQIPSCTEIVSFFQTWGGVRGERVGGRMATVGCAFT